jgi:hypothetical protein
VERIIKAEACICEAVREDGSRADDVNLLSHMDRRGKGRAVAAEGVPDDFWLFQGSGEKPE